MDPLACLQCPLDCWPSRHACCLAMACCRCCHSLTAGRTCTFPCYTYAVLSVVQGGQSTAKLYARHCTLDHHAMTTSTTDLTNPIRCDHSPLTRTSATTQQHLYTMLSVPGGIYRTKMRVSCSPSSSWAVLGPLWRSQRCRTVPFMASVFGKLARVRRRPRTSCVNVSALTNGMISGVDLAKEQSPPVEHISLEEMQLTSLS